MIDSKQYFSPWQFGMPALVKVKGEFRICPTYRLITRNIRISAAAWLKKKLQRPAPAAKLLALSRSSRCTAKRVEIGDEKMRELKLSSPLNIQIITESERMALLNREVT